MTYLAMTECILSIELPGILDLDIVTPVRVQDKNGTISPADMSLCSILVEVTVPSLGNTLILMITAMGDREFEGVFPTHREHKGEATKIAKYVASAIM